MQVAFVAKLHTSAEDMLGVALRERIVRVTEYQGSDAVWVLSSQVCSPNSLEDISGMVCVARRIRGDDVDVRAQFQIRLEASFHSSQSLRFHIGKPDFTYSNMGRE